MYVSVFKISVIVETVKAWQIESNLQVEVWIIHELTFNKAEQPIVVSVVVVQYPLVVSVEAIY